MLTSGPSYASDPLARIRVPQDSGAEVLQAALEVLDSAVLHGAFLPEPLPPTYALHPKGPNQAVAVEVSVHSNQKSLLAGTQSDCPMRIPRVNWSDLGVLKGLLGMNLRCCLCHCRHPKGSIEQRTLHHDLVLPGRRRSQPRRSFRRSLGRK